MTKIDIISGFLGAGKTTLINKLIAEAYKGEKIVLIENEFGEIGVDGGFLQQAGVQIAEINSGCICCSLVGDFSEALRKVVSDYTPDRILIEPSGVGKLSDVTKAVVSAELVDANINSAVVVVDVNKCKMYMKNFGEFFNDQIEHATCIYFSHTDKASDTKIAEALALVREHNAKAQIITTPADKLDINALINAFENKDTLAEQLSRLMDEQECPVCGHHHEHHEHGHGHEHHHHHHEHEECHEHHHHEHHHDGEECHCHDDHEHHHHHHHHEHVEECHCHEHHHHADEVFVSWGRETVNKYTCAQMREILAQLEDAHRFGTVLRAKGIVQGTDGAWIHFDLIPGEINVRTGSASTIGKICVIGAHIREKSLGELFGV